MAYVLLVDVGVALVLPILVGLSSLCLWSRPNIVGHVVRGLRDTICSLCRVQLAQHMVSTEVEACRLTRCSGPVLCHCTEHDVLRRVTTMLGLMLRVCWSGTSDNCCFKDDEEPGWPPQQPDKKNGDYDLREEPGHVTSHRQGGQLSDQNRFGRSATPVTDGSTSSRGMVANRLALSVAQGGQTRPTEPPSEAETNTVKGAGGRGQDLVEEGGGGSRNTFATEATQDEADLNAQGDEDDRDEMAFDVGENAIDDREDLERAAGRHQHGGEVETSKDLEEEEEEEEADGGRGADRVAGNALGGADIAEYDDDGDGQLLSGGGDGGAPEEGEEEEEDELLGVPDADVIKEEEEADSNRVGLPEGDEGGYMFPV